MHIDVYFNQLNSQRHIFGINCLKQFNNNQNGF